MPRARHTIVRGREDAAGQARRFVTLVLDSWDLSYCRDTLARSVVELLDVETDAAAGSSGVIALLLDHSDRVLALSVSDGTGRFRSVTAPTLQPAAA